MTTNRPSWYRPKAVTKEASKTSGKTAKDWPLFARAMRFFREPEDIGVGDTIARIIGPNRSHAFKEFYRKTFGKDCGCGNRQQRLNRLYPYPK
jgi:hypothetical protein